MDRKIIHLVTPYLFHTGSWVYSQIKGVKEFEQFVFTQKRDNIEQFPLDNIYSIEDENIIKRNINYFYKRLTKKHGLFFSKDVNRIKPNLFHAHMGFEAWAWLDFIKKTELPLVSTFYGLDVSRLGQIPLWRKRYKKLFEYGSIFLAEGTNLKQQLVNIGCPSEKIIVQKLGINIDKYNPKKYSNKGTNSKIVILQVSTFREKKGIEYSLKAISVLKSKGYYIEFNLIGAGDNKESELELKKQVETLGISDVVNFLGKKTHHESLKEMSNADIFLHPSVNAKDGDNEGGAPVGIIEASAIGLPVVSTLHADIPEVIKNGKTGFLVEEKNSEALANKIAELINNSEKMVSFGKAGREYILNNYDNQKIVPKLENIYKSIL